MSTRRSVLLRRARPWLLAAAAVQLALRGGGLLAARRLEVGDPSSARIRRVKTLGQVTMKADSKELARIELDLVLAGGRLDLTAASPAPGGIDLILTCALAGAEVRVPETWRISTDTHGPGGVTVKGALTTVNPASADLRVDLRAFGGGATLTAG